MSHSITYYSWSIFECTSQEQHRIEKNIPKNAFSESSVKFYLSTSPTMVYYRWCSQNRSTSTSMLLSLRLPLLIITLHSAATNSFSEISANSLSADTCAMSLSSSSKFRSVRKIMPRPSPHWVGDGFKVYPVFANLAFTEELSPLLMFDYAEPRKFPANFGAPLGVGQHPHRGFETVTLAFQGEVEHHDSTGKSGVIGPGDVQWMTAGRGIIHQEYHSKEFTKEGGIFEFCQVRIIIALVSYVSLLYALL